jgi:hypothetical protein
MGLACDAGASSSRRLRCQRASSATRRSAPQHAWALPAPGAETYTAHCHRRPRRFSPTRFIRRHAPPCLRSASARRRINAIRYAAEFNFRSSSKVWMPSTALLASICVTRQQTPRRVYCHYIGRPTVATMWWMSVIVALAGCIGGAVNASMTDNGFPLPRKEQAPNGTTILRPGYLGNVLVGGVAALISWGLYGPLGAFVVFGTEEATKANSSDRIGLSLASLMGALLVGVGGARWLSNEVDKNLMRNAAAEAAGKQSSSGASRQIAMTTPAQALQVAMNMQ